MEQIHTTRLCLERGMRWVFGLFFVLLFTTQSQAQVSAYSFSTSTGGTLVDMTAATTLPITGDDAASAVTSIGFNFTLAGTVYTQFSVNTNGLMRLGPTGVSTAYSNSLISASDNPKICPWWDDQHTGTGGSVKYLLTGVAPNRKLVVQWNLVNCCGGTPDKTYQAWLNETSNTIQFVYGTMGGTASSSVGLCNSISDFNAVLTSSNTNYNTGTETTNSTMPASGRVYTFSPPTPCTGTPVAGSIPLSQGACTGSTTTITATGYTAGVSGITLQWEQSNDGVTGWVNAIGGTGATTSIYTTPVITGPIYYRVKVTCTATGLFDYTNVCSVAVTNCTFDITYEPSGATYTSIMPAAGGTGLTVPGWQNTSGDDNTSLTVPLTGTTFSYQGTPVTGFRVCSNGWMTFNTATTATTFSNSLASSSQNKVLAPFWDDLVFTGQNFANANNCVRYQVDGTLGSGIAVITIEWAGMERYVNPGPNWNFQVKLYEETNNIEFVYGPFEGYDGTNYTTHSYSVGYNGTNPLGTGPADRFALQQPLTNYFSSASDPAANNVMPNCYSKYVLVPGTYTGPVTAPAIPVPLNDNLGGAISLPVNSIQCTSPNLCGTYYTSRGATNSGVGTAPCATAGSEDDDVWFTFSTTAVTDYTIKVRPSPSYDAVVQLYDGAMNPIACSNSFGVATSGAAGIETISATGLTPGGANYIVRVFNVGAGYGYSGEFSLCVYQSTPPPANDECAGAIDIAVGTSCSYIAGTSVSATASVTAPVACSGIADDDVWYKFVATGSNPVINCQSGGGYNAVLSLYSGTCGALTNIGCANATTTAGLETINATGLVIGQTYYIRIYHNTTGAGSGNFTLCVYNPVPGCTTYISPADGTTGVLGTGTTLSWSAATYATSYDVYFDVVTPPVAFTNTAATSWATGPLAPATTYYWRIVPKNDVGSAVGCAIYSFSSVAGCTGTPVAGSATTTATSVCTPASTFTLGLAGATTDAGITYQWQADAGAGYSDIAGATAATYSATEAVTTTYICNLTCTASGLSASSNPVMVTFSATPVGDVLANPILIPSLPYTATGNNLSVNCWQNDFVGQASPDVFYRMTASCNGLLNMNMCSGGTLTDTYLHILDGAGTLLASNDDSGPSCTGLLSSINYTVTAGSVYYIVVEGFSTNTGTYTLNVSLTPTFVTYYADADADGFGNAGVTALSCDGTAPAGFVSNNLDCNDAQLQYGDLDGDGFAGTTLVACGLVTSNDCDDSNSGINPSATEICDGLDNDCDGTIDEGTATATVTPSPSAVTCKSVPLVFQANYGVGYTYQWFKNGNLIPGATDQTYATDKAGYYQVQVNVPGGCFALSAASSLSVNPNPNSNISAPNGTSLCTTVKLKASYDASYSWQWYQDGVAIPGATSYLYLATAPASYYCTVTSALGCSRNTSSMTVTACREGDVPVSNDQITVFPNPTDNLFTVELMMAEELNGTANIYVTTITGANVYTSQATVTNGYLSQNITLGNDIAAGVYMVKVVINGKQYQQQISVVK